MPARLTPPQTTPSRGNCAPRKKTEPVPNNTHTPKLCRKLAGLNLESEMASIFSREGEILWVSPSYPVPHVLFGFGWQEFVFQEDIPCFLKHIADGVDGCHYFRCMRPSNGEYVWVRHDKFHFPCTGEGCHRAVVCFGRDAVISIATILEPCQSPEPRAQSPEPRAQSPEPRAQSWAAA